VIAREPYDLEAVLQPGRPAEAGIAPVHLHAGRAGVERDRQTGGRRLRSVFQVRHPDRAEGGIDRSALIFGQQPGAPGQALPLPGHRTAHPARHRSGEVGQVGPALGGRSSVEGVELTAEPGQPRPGRVLRPPCVDHADPLDLDPIADEAAGQLEGHHAAERPAHQAVGRLDRSLGQAVELPRHPVLDGVQPDQHLGVGGWSQCVEGELAVGGPRQLGQVGGLHEPPRVHEHDRLSAHRCSL